MDAESFDYLTRSVSTLLSRRAVTSVLGIGVFALPSFIAAKKRRHKHKKKIKRNAFGCVNVGNFCKNDDQCCSGICQGKKGKKKCQAHDSSTCQAGTHEEECDLPHGTNVPCVSSTGDSGLCDTTTGRGAYCEADGGCFDCKKDADCVPFCGPQAACILCPECVPFTGTGTSCVGPTDGGCTFPP
jgi:hypothetical protein